MKLLDVEIRWPGFWPTTSAVAVGVLLWTLLTLSPLGAEDSTTASANLVAIVFGCVSNAAGIEVKRGGRHMLLNILGCLIVMAMFRVIAEAIT